MTKTADQTKRIYLASPYSPVKWWQKLPVIEWIVRWLRFRAVNKVAAKLMMQGNLVFSPLSHSHPISKHCTVDPCDHDFWLRQDLWVLSVCDEMHILCLPGWEASKGIKTEMDHAEAIGLPVVMVDTDG